MVGGSVASSSHGIPRSTNDIDIVADIRQEHISRFVSELAGAFYADPDTMHEALHHERSFNLIHFASGAKFDIFPVARNRYAEVQIERSVPQKVPGLNILCPVASAEDTILAKLIWYRAGGEQSDQQWNDLRGVRSVQGSRLDRTYMQDWAQQLKVDDLLKRLMSEEEPG
jgi:hypothetical protein